MEDKVKKDMIRFKAQIRSKAEAQTSYYVTVEILKKIKFKHNGKSTVDKPSHTVLFNVTESNLPMPASVYNPVFMFKRANAQLVEKDGKWVTQSEADDYIGAPSPEQYFTLPDVDNIINSDAVVTRDDKKFIGEVYLASMFIKSFESAEVADVYIGRMRKDLEEFLAAMSNFMKEKKSLFAWEGYGIMGATKAGGEIKNYQMTVPSFTEKAGPNVRTV